MSTVKVNLDSTQIGCTNRVYMGGYGWFGAKTGSGLHVASMLRELGPLSLCDANYAQVALQTYVHLSPEVSAPQP